MEHMKQWESKQPVNVESGINMDDSNKKLLRSLGPRSVQQLTGTILNLFNFIMILIIKSEEQQLKLAMQRSLVEDEEDEDVYDYDEADSQCSYLTKDVRPNASPSWIKSDVCEGRKNYSTGLKTLTNAFVL